MQCSREIDEMVCVAKGQNTAPPYSPGGRWTEAKQISDISGFTHGVGWYAPQQEHAN